MALDGTAECGCQDLRLSDGIPTARYVERCNYNVDEHLHHRSTISFPAERDRDTLNTLSNASIADVPDSMADLHKSLPLGGSKSDRTNATVTSKSINSLEKRNTPANRQHHHNSRHSQTQSKPQSQDSRSQLHASKSTVAATQTPYLYDSRRLHDESSIAYHDYDSAAFPLSSANSSSEVSRTSSQHVSPSGGGFLGYDDLSHTIHSSYNSHGGYSGHTHTHSRTASYTHPAIWEDMDTEAFSRTFQAGTTLCNACGTQVVDSKCACPHDEISNDGLSKSESGYSWKSDGSDCDDELIGNPEPLTSIILPGKPDTASQSQPYPYEPSGKSGPLATHARRDVSHQPADAGGSKPYVSSNGKRGAYGAQSNSTSTNHGGLGQGQGQPLLPTHTHSPAPVNYSRKLSAKEKMAAARRRRHSVELLEFAGLSGCDTQTFLRHIRLHKYTMMLSHLAFSTLLEMGDDGLIRAGMIAQGARTRLLKALDRYKLYLEAGSLSSPTHRYGAYDTRDSHSNHDSRDVDKAAKPDHICDAKSGLTKHRTDVTYHGYDCGGGAMMVSDGTYADCVHTQQQQEAQMELHHQLQVQLHQNTLSSQVHTQVQQGQHTPCTANCAMGLCGFPPTSMQQVQVQSAQKLYQLPNGPVPTPHHAQFQAHTGACGPLHPASQSQQHASGHLSVNGHPANCTHLGPSSLTHHQHQPLCGHHQGVALQPPAHNQQAQGSTTATSKAHHKQSSGHHNQPNNCSNKSQQQSTSRSARGPKGGPPNNPPQPGRSRQATQSTAYNPPQAQRMRNSGGRLSGGTNSSTHVSTHPHPLKNCSNKGTVLLPTCTAPSATDGMSPQINCAYPVAHSAVPMTQDSGCGPGLEFCPAGGCGMAHVRVIPTEYMQQQIQLHHTQTQAQVRVQMQATQQAHQRLQQHQRQQHSCSGLGGEGECQFGTNADSISYRNPAIVRERERSISSPDTLTYFYAQQRKVRYYSDSVAPARTSGVSPEDAYAFANFSDPSSVHQFAQGNNLVLGNGISRSLPAVYTQPHPHSNTITLTNGDPLQQLQYQPRQQPQPQQRHAGQIRRQSTSPSTQTQSVVTSTRAGVYSCHNSTGTVTTGDGGGASEGLRDTFTLTHNTSASTYSHPPAFGVAGVDRVPKAAGPTDSVKDARRMTQPFISWPSFGTPGTELPYGTAATQDVYAERHLSHAKVNRVKSQPTARTAPTSALYRTGFDLDGTVKRANANANANATHSPRVVETTGHGHVGRYNAKPGREAGRETFVYPPPVSADAGGPIFGPPVSPLSQTVSPLSPSDPEYTRYPVSAASLVATEESNPNSRFHRVAFFRGARKTGHYPAPSAVDRVLYAGQAESDRRVLYPGQIDPMDRDKGAIYSGLVGAIESDSTQPGMGRGKASHGNAIGGESCSATPDTARLGFGQTATVQPEKSDSLLIRQSAVAPMSNEPGPEPGPGPLHGTGTYSPGDGGSGSIHSKSAYAPELGTGSYAPEENLSSADDAHNETDAVAEESAAVARLLSNLDLEGEKVYPHDAAKARYFDFLSPSLDSAMDKYRGQAVSYLRGNFTTGRRNGGSATPTRDSTELQHQRNMEVFGPSALCAMAPIDTSSHAMETPRYPEETMVGKLVDTLTVTPSTSHVSAFKTAPTAKDKDRSSTRTVSGHLPQTLSHSLAPGTSRREMRDCDSAMDNGGAGERNNGQHNRGLGGELTFTRHRMSHSEGIVVGRRMGAITRDEAETVVGNATRDASTEYPPQSAADTTATRHDMAAKSAFDFTGLLGDAGRQPVPG